MTFDQVMQVGTLLCSAAAVLVALRVKREIGILHILTNSMADRTEMLARKAGLAEGELKGRADQTAERKAEKEQ